MESRLSEFRVDGLFGLYDHRITLNRKERITIIIGPNGRGKTVCLKMIEALFAKNFGFFSDVLFRSAAFVFDSGERISISQVPKTTVEESPDGTTEFRFEAPQRGPIIWRPSIGDARVSRELRRYVGPVWHQIGPNLWHDERDGEELTTIELIERHRIPEKVRESLRESLQLNAPKEITNLLARTDCHLIETQRLLVLSSSSADDDDDYVYVQPHGRRPRISRIAIQQKAQKLRSIIKETIGKYASLSQSLDRSFPLRLFEAQGTPAVTQDQLRAKLKGLDGRREALMKAGIQDTEYKSVSMQGGNIEPGVARALEIYVSDAVDKLDVFNDLLARLDLFKELIANRFLDKRLEIDRENGFKFVSRTGTSVPLDKLSSGEQHQLILIFDLLFEVSNNSLILIDEPELSLHVAWQKSFIESLRRIIELNGFDVILATHSPAVVAKHFSLAVELGPVDE
jgi:predicted ATP-binding protein involved in virulence